MTDPNPYDPPTSEEPEPDDNEPVHLPTRTPGIAMSLAILAAMAALVVVLIVAAIDFVTESK